MASKFFTVDNVKLPKFNKAEAKAEIANLDLKQLQAKYLELAERAHKVKVTYDLLATRVGAIESLAQEAFAAADTEVEIETF